MNNSNKTDKIFFPHFDVIRFVAAFMIVILHAYEAWNGWYGRIGILTGGTYKEFTNSGRLTDQFIKNLGIGVDIFFLLSGFLITYILMEEKKKYNSIDIKKFIFRRCLRIWPLYFLLIGITPFLMAWLHDPQPDYLHNLLFLNNFNTIVTKAWTYPFSHYWSICIEEHFYILWPFLIAFVPNKRLILTFTFIILLSISYRIFVSYTNPDPWFSLFLHTLSRIDVIVIGAIGAFLYSGKSYTFSLNRTTRIILYAVLIVSLCIEPVVQWNSPFLAGFKNYFYMGIIAVLLLDFNFNPGFKYLIPEKSFIHYLGKISYGIYMYSNFLLVIIIKKIMWAQNSTNIYLFFFLVIFLSILVPIISYELLEKHILKFSQKFRKIRIER